jgi:phage terminase Nu1 subunit (DNA packaging protein)
MQRADYARVKTQTNSEQTIDRASDCLLNKRELASRVRVSTRTIDDWQRRGRITYFKIGKSARYRWDDVIAKLSELCRVN